MTSQCSAASFRRWRSRANGWLILAALRGVGVPSAAFLRSLVAASRLAFYAAILLAVMSLIRVVEPKAAFKCSAIR
jgi:hypothetical protein